MVASIGSVFNTDACAPFKLAVPSADSAAADGDDTAGDVALALLSWLEDAAATGCGGCTCTRSSNGSAPTAAAAVDANAIIADAAGVSVEGIGTVDTLPLIAAPAELNHSKHNSNIWVNVFTHTRTMNMMGMGYTHEHANNQTQNNSLHTRNTISLPTTSRALFQDTHVYNEHQTLVARTCSGTDGPCGCTLFRIARPRLQKVFLCHRLWFSFTKRSGIIGSAHALSSKCGTRNENIFMTRVLCRTSVLG